MTNQPVNSANVWRLFADDATYVMIVAASVNRRGSGDVMAAIDDDANGQPIDHVLTALTQPARVL